LLLNKRVNVLLFSAKAGLKKPQEKISAANAAMLKLDRRSNNNFFT
jgi:hypothetical protein